MNDRAYFLQTETDKNGLNESDKCRIHIKHVQSILLASNFQSDFHYALPIPRICGQIPLTKQTHIHG